MIKENYKAIAEIMKSNQVQRTTFSTIKDLADYFEKERNNMLIRKATYYHPKHSATKPELFNRKQFLEWCGVK